MSHSGRYRPMGDRHKKPRSQCGVCRCRRGVAYIFWDGLAAPGLASDFAAAGLAADLASVFISEPSSDLPFTCRPAVDSFLAFLPPPPLTRFSKSAQSLKSPPLVRSSMMVFDVFGPMPLTLSKAAASALLTSTCAKA